MCILSKIDNCERQLPFDSPHRQWGEEKRRLRKNWCPPKYKIPIFLIFLSNSSSCSEVLRLGPLGKPRLGFPLNQWGRKRKKEVEKKHKPLFSKWLRSSQRISSIFSKRSGGCARWGLIYIDGQNMNIFTHFTLLTKTIFSVQYQTMESLMISSQHRLTQKYHLPFFCTDRI